MSRCPHCEVKTENRFRDEHGNAWHMMPGGHHLPCYERNRATDYEVSEELRNKAYEDRMAGRDE